MQQEWIEELTQIMGKEKTSMSETNLYRHSRDESYFTPIEPDIVVFPESTDDVVAIMNFARNKQISITPYGAGSGLEGQAIPLSKGISINFERMNKILSFNPEDLTVTVQPGISRMELNQAINNQGLYFPIDPGADASIGGMTATNASGTTAVRYGSMRDQILDLEVVLPNGSVIHTGSRAKKSSSGYHLNGMFVGSEGTLGILTEITLKLHGTPEHIVAARCTFRTAKECVEAAQLVLQSGIQVLRMEFVDEHSIKQVNQYGSYQFPEGHSLFFEFAGTKTAAEDVASTVEELMRDLNCENWERKDNSKDRAELWKARHEMIFAFRHKKGLEMNGADVCVPISKLADLVVYTRELIDQSILNGGILGHVGDGNFHTAIMYDPKNKLEVDTAKQINEQITYRAIELGGTCTGEHGVGIGKMKYQQVEHEEALTLMKQLKQMIDPMNIMNPGKLLPNM
ncbi:MULTISPECIES: FAD-binding oxidoreductase [Bacillus]|uniref:FAD-binding oxidoreductase n=1 Tax=Bacillus TaxID=1386 RepID=UPI0003149A7E|nr:MULTISPECIES: FAD-linked oxidase C-terminal domain-containing protein [Bacillus]